MIQQSDSIKNYNVCVKGSNVVVRSYGKITTDNSNLIKVYMVQGAKIGVCTGYYETDSDGYDWYQFWLLDKPSGELTGWAREDKITLPDQYIGVYSPEVNQQDAQNLVQGIIDNDISLWKQLTICGPLLKRASDNGIDITNQKIVFDSLVSSYSARQEHMNNSAMLKIKGSMDQTQDWINSKIDWNYVASIPSYNGIDGLAGFWLAFAVGAAAVAVVGYLVYQEFKPDYEKGKVDLKVSGEFKKWLDTLPADKQAAIKKDLQNQLDDAYNQGKSAQFWHDFGNIIIKAAEYIGIPLVAIVIGRRFLRSNKNKKN